MSASGLQFPALVYSEFTLAMVLAPATLPASPNSWADGGFLGIQDGAEDPSLLGLSGTAAVNRVGWAGDGPTAASTGVLDTTPALYVFVASAGFLSVRKNGAQVGVYALPDPWTHAFRYISGWVEADEGGAGEVAEVKLWSRPALPQELEVLETELALKWGLPYVGPGALPVVDSWEVTTGPVFSKKGFSTSVFGYQARPGSYGVNPIGASGALVRGDSRLLSVHELVDQGLTPERSLFVEIEDPQGLGATGAWQFGVTQKNGKEVIFQATWANNRWTGERGRTPLFLDSRTRRSWPLKVRLIKL